MNLGLRHFSKLYALPAALYPGAFCRAFGAEMREVFLVLLTGALLVGPLAGVIGRPLARVIRGH